MRVHTLVLVLAAAAMAVSVPAHADKVYKWVDAQGVTHYGEKAPQEAANATKVKVSDTTSSDVDTELERLEKTRQAAKAAKSADGEEPVTAAPPPKGQSEANSQACEKHRKNLEALKSGRPVRVLDEAGKARAIGDEERKAQLELAESELKRCEQIEKVRAAAGAK